MNLYSYDGPVMEFDICVNSHWKGSTYAPSESKARSNLTYQYKKEKHKSPATKIRLTGKLKIIE